MKICKHCGKSAPTVVFARNRATCVECRRPIKAAYNKTTTAVRASWANSLKKHGLSVEDFAWLVLSQGFRCAICAGDLDFAKLTHVDHDHATGRIRGVLCTHCNRGLGAFCDDTRLLNMAAKYLDSRNN